MMVLGMNAGALGGHLGGWRHHDAFTSTAMQLKNAIEVAKLAERGKFDLLFLADGNGVRQMDKPALFAANSPSDRPTVFEPVTLFSALSQHTTHIGFVATATTSYDPPFLLARKFASLDHLSGGRAGWNLVTTQYVEDAKNFGPAEHFGRETRYEMARECLDVVRALWDSWGEDAFVQDKATGRYLDPAKVRSVNHVGRYFSVSGPLNVARSPQGQPVVFMAGQSEAGLDLAAYGAEGLFGSASNLAEAQKVYADIKGRMANYRRPPDALRIMPGMSVFVGRTSAEADELYDELQSLISPTLAVTYLSKIVGFDVSAFPIDGPMPHRTIESVGGTAIGRSVLVMAAREALTVRQTYDRILPSMGGCIAKAVRRRSPISWRPGIRRRVATASCCRCQYSHGHCATSSNWWCRSCSGAGCSVPIMKARLCGGICDWQSRQIRSRRKQGWQPSDPARGSVRARRPEISALRNPHLVGTKRRAALLYSGLRNALVLRLPFGMPRRRGVIDQPWRMLRGPDMNARSHTRIVVQCRDPQEHAWLGGEFGNHLRAADGAKPPVLAGRGGVMAELVFARCPAKMPAFDACRAVEGRGVGLPTGGAMAVHDRPVELVRLKADRATQATPVQTHCLASRQSSDLTMDPQTTRDWCKGRRIRGPLATGEGSNIVLTIHLQRGQEG